MKSAYAILKDNDNIWQDQEAAERLRFDRHRKGLEKIMILKDIWMDVKAVQERDPAARSALEVLLLYQGVHALIWHRFAHWFYKHHMFFIARWISQMARFFTLIEIHPGAQLGHGILIDHGCGVVIGETTVPFTRALPWAVSEPRKASVIPPLATM